MAAALALLLFSVSCASHTTTPSAPHLGHVLLMLFGEAWVPFFPFLPWFGLREHSTGRASRAPSPRLRSPIITEPGPGRGRRPLPGGLRLAVEAPSPPRLSRLLSRHSPSAFLPVSWARSLVPAPSLPLHLTCFSSPFLALLVRDGVSLGGGRLSCRGTPRGTSAPCACEVPVLRRDGRLVTMATGRDVTGQGLQVKWQEQVSVEAADRHVCRSPPRPHPPSVPGARRAVSGSCGFLRCCGESVCRASACCSGVGLTECVNLSSGGAGTAAA